MSEPPSLPLAMRPQGVAGRVFGFLMEWMNRGAYRAALSALAPQAVERFLEIGFGTGRFAELLLASAPGIRVAGVDPAETMVIVANARPGVREAEAHADLRLGDDTDLPFDPSSFDGVVALHSFQFFADPARTLSTIHRLLKPAGRFVLVLRDHSRSAPDWLPNPVSRSGDEVGGAMQLLAECGFFVTQVEPGVLVARPGGASGGEASAVGSQARAAERSPEEI